jgi:hypothetical protein
MSLISSRIFRIFVLDEVRRPSASSTLDPFLCLAPPQPKFQSADKGHGARTPKERVEELLRSLLLGYHGDDRISAIWFLVQLWQESTDVS